MISIKYHKYRDWKIKLKLLAISAILILCSVFLVSVLSYIRYTRDFEKQSAKHIQQIIEQVSLNIDTYMDDLFRLSLSPYYSNSVMNALVSGAAVTDVEKLEKSRIIEDFLDEMMIIPRKDIIRVYILADGVYSSKRTQTGIDAKTDFTKFDWYKQAMLTLDPVFIPVHVEPLDKDPNLKIFSVVRQLRSTKGTNRTIGVIKVDANYTGIKEICIRADMGREGRLLIADENNNIIYPGDKDNRDIAWYSKVKAGIGSKTSPYFIESIDGKDYIINHTKIKRSNWTVIAVNSLEELNQNAISTRNNAFILAVLFSVLAIIILVIYIKRFLSPLMDIVKLMKEVQNGNLEVSTKQAGNDEIGYLSRSFNSMVVNIKDMLRQNTTLVQEVYEAKFLQKEAQFKALYSQIRPHFIYNTLNMISLMIQCDKQEAAVENINRLSSILRGMAVVDRETNVQNEIELLEAYLSIQKDRYTGRLEYSVDIDNRLLTYEVPALLFQPIVENAVIHGCESRRMNTMIRVTGTISEHLVMFSIMDNGKGMDAEALEKLRSRVQETDNPAQQLQSSHNGSEKAHGIGLVNVNRRIKLKYGSEYGLQIDSSLGEGTTVSIRLPVLKQNGGNIDV